MIRRITEFVDTTMMSLNELWSWFLRGTEGEYGAKKASGGGTDINKPGRTLRKKRK